MNKTCRSHKIVTGLLGACLALWIIKLGTPVILDAQVTPPQLARNRFQSLANQLGLRPPRHQPPRRIVALEL